MAPSKIFGLITKNFSYKQMNAFEFVTQLNAIHQSEYASAIEQTPVSSSKIIENALQALYSKNADSFKQIGLSQLNSLEELGQYNGRTLSIEGTVIDVFDPKLLVCRRKKPEGPEFLLFNDLLPEPKIENNSEEHDFYKEIASCDFADLNCYLLLVNCENNGIVEQIWDLISSGKAMKTKANGFPILIRSLFPRESLNLGGKFRLSGFLSGINLSEKDKDLALQPNPELAAFTGEMYYENAGIPVLSVVHYEPEASLAQSPKDADCDFKPLVFALIRRFYGTLKDHLAAHLLLISLCSFETLPGTDNINYLNLNIFGMDRPTFDQLSELLQQLKIKAQVISITAESLEQPMIAEKDLQCEVLKFNQIYPGMKEAVLTEEFGLSAANLTEPATLNVMRLAKIADCQTLMVKYFDKNFVSFPFENAFVSFSTTRSIFRHKLRLRLKKNEGLEIGQLPFLPSLPSGSNLFQGLKAAVQKYLEKCVIENASMPEIESDFVKERQSNPEFSQEDFGTVLVLAKYEAFFNGEAEVTARDYFQAKQMFLEMREREKEYLEKCKHKDN